MTAQTNISTHVVTLEAGDILPLHGTFDSVNVHRATGAIRVKFGAGGNWTDWAGAREYIPGASFEGFWVQNASQSAIEVEVSTAQGRVRDYALRIENDQLNTRQGSPDVFDTGAPVTVPDASTTALAAANPLRREILVVNTSTTATVYIGGNAGAVAGQGLPIFPTQSHVLETSAAVYARNDSGGDVALAVAEMEWSA